MQGSIVREKAYKYALRIVNLYKYLTEAKKEYILSKQLLRSGTSIGANIEEALGGQSTKDFYAKFTIAYKEARETRYWLCLLKDAEYLNSKEAELMINECEELLKIISKIQTTIKHKLTARNL